MLSTLHDKLGVVLAPWTFNKEAKLLTRTPSEISPSPPNELARASSSTACMPATRSYASSNASTKRRKGAKASGFLNRHFNGPDGEEKEDYEEAEGAADDLIEVRVQDQQCWMVSERQMLMYLSSYRISFQKPSSPRSIVRRIKSTSHPSFVDNQGPTTKHRRYNAEEILSYLDMTDV